MTPRVPLRIAVIAPVRFPIRRPHAGGLESAVWNEVEQLRARGHDVTLVAPVGSDRVDPDGPFALPTLQWPVSLTPSDETYPPSLQAEVLPALDRALDVIAASPGRFDVISNHCLNGLPLQRAGELGVPMISTLHTPVDLELVRAHQSVLGRGSRFLSVSEHTRRQWLSVGIDSTVLPNAVDPTAWPLGPGGDDLVWFGRIVPEKAPHLAIDIAERLGRPLVLAGRIGDQRYAERFVFPRLNSSIRYVGLLPPESLSEIVGRSACSIATPAWDEPFGLVAPEALMCGTPVASFAVGGVSEIASSSLGMATATEGDVDGLASAAADLIARTVADPSYRASIRSSAERHYSLATRVAALEHHFMAMMDDRTGVPEQVA